MPAPSFAEVLDDALAGAGAHARRTVAWSAAAGVRDAADPFVFARPMSPGAAWTRSYPRPGAPPAPPPSRPRLEAPRLDAVQQHAFDRLVALGATLSATFTADDLKREYRRLALRYHPDRRTAGLAAGPSDASATFATIADACRCLRQVVEPRH